MSQRVKTKDDQYTAELESIETGVSISWSKHKTGTNIVRTMAHKSGDWVSITISETPEGGRTTQTSASLGREAAQALYQQLHAIYGR